jgi:hypothetical protein
VTDAWAAPAATGGTGLSRIDTVTVANVDVYTVTLTWTASASADRYKVFFTPDSINYYLAPLPAGASMLTRGACVCVHARTHLQAAAAGVGQRWGTAYTTLTTFVVSGLSEFTSYYFQVYAGDASSFDVNFFTPLPSATTLIAGTCLGQADARMSTRLTRWRGRWAAPVVNATTAVSTLNSIKFSWRAGSSLTAYFLVYGRRASNSRELPTDSWTLLQNSTSTELTATSLTSGAVYTFKVTAVSPSGESLSTTSYSFQTASITNAGATPEGSTCRRCHPLAYCTV